MHRRLAYGALALAGLAAWVGAAWAWRAYAVGHPAVSAPVAAPLGGRWANSLPPDMAARLATQDSAHPRALRQQWQGRAPERNAGADAAADPGTVASAPR